MSSLFSLVGTVEADTSGFEQALDETAKSSEAAFSRIAVSARKYLGAGGLLWTMRRVMAESNQFNQTMADLSAITDRNTRAMSKSLLALDGALGRPIRSAYTLYETVSAGIRGSEQELTNFVESAGKAAKVIRAEMYTTSNAMTTLMHAYQIPINESNKLIDSFYTIVKEGKAHGHELARTLGLVANSASEAGLSLNEMFAAAASLSRTMTPSNAMISLNQMMNSFMGPTEKSKRAAKEFGIEMSSTALKTKGFAAVLRDVHEKVGGNVEAIKSLFGNIRAARGALALTGKQFYNFIDILEEFEFAAGRGEEALAKQLDTSQAAMERMHASIDKLKITVGTDLDAFAKAFYKTVDGVISGFNRSGKAATEFFESVGVAKDSPFLQFFSGIEEHTKSFSRFVFYALVAVKTFKNLKMILTEISFELKKIEAAQASRAMQQKMQKPAPALTDVAPDKTVSKTKTRTETVPTEELKTELNAIRAALRQATRDLKEISKVTDGIVDIVDGSDGLKTQILNIRDALVQFNREAKVLYREIVSAGDNLTATKEQMALVNAEKTIEAVNGLYLQFKEFITKVETLRASAAETNQALTASNAESKTAYAQVLQVIDNLVTQARTTAESLATFSNVMTEINSTFATVIANAKIVAADVTRLTTNLHNTHLAMSARYPGDVVSSSKSIREIPFTKEGLSSVFNWESDKPTPSTKVKAPPAKLPVPPSVMGNRQIQQSDLEEYIITGFLSSGKSTKLADDFYSDLKTDLPEGYFTRPKGEFNVSKFREDVARRSTYRPEGDAYRSYTPYQSPTGLPWKYNRANPEYRKALSAARRKHIGGGEMSPLPLKFSDDPEIALQEAQEYMRKEAERWGESVGLQIEAIDGATDNVEKASEASKKAGEAAARAGKELEKNAKTGWGIGDWGMAIFGGISAAQMGWNIGLAIAEKFKFDESKLFQTIADSFMRTEGSTFDKLEQVDEYNLGAISRGVLKKLEQLAEAGEITELEKQKYFRQINKAYSLGSTKESLTRIKAVEEKLLEETTKRTELANEQNKVSKALNDEMLELKSEITRLRNRLKGEEAGYTPEEKAEIKTKLLQLKTSRPAEILTQGREESAGAMGFFEALRLSKESLDNAGQAQLLGGTTASSILSLHMGKYIDEINKEIIENVDDDIRLTKEQLKEMSIREGVQVFTDTYIEQIYDALNPKINKDQAKRELKELKVSLEQKQVIEKTNEALYALKEMAEEATSAGIENIIEEIKTAGKYGAGGAAIAKVKAGTKDAILLTVSEHFAAANSYIELLESDPTFKGMSPENKRIVLANAKETVSTIWQKYIQASEEARNFGIKSIEASIDEMRSDMEKSLGRVVVMPHESLTEQMLLDKRKALIEMTKKMDSEISDQKDKVEEAGEDIPGLQAKLLEEEAKLDIVKKNKMTEQIKIGKARVAEIKNKIKAQTEKVENAQERLDGLVLERFQVIEERIQAASDIYEHRREGFRFGREKAEHMYDIGQIGISEFTQEYLQNTDQLIASLEKQISAIKEDNNAKRELQREQNREIKGRRDFIRDLEDNSRQLRDSVFGSVRDLVGDKFTSNSLYHAINMLGMVQGPQTLQRLTSPTLSINQGYGMVDAQKAQKAVAASLDSYIMSQRYAQANIGKTVSKIYDVLKSGGTIVVR